MPNYAILYLFIYVLPSCSMDMMSYAIDTCRSLAVLAASAGNATAAEQWMACVNATYLTLQQTLWDSGLPAAKRKKERTKKERKKEGRKDGGRKENEFD